MSVQFGEVLQTEHTQKVSTQISSVQLLSCVRLFATPWTAACQVSLSVTNSRSLFKLMSMCVRKYVLLRVTLNPKISLT